MTTCGSLLYDSRFLKKDLWPKMSTWVNLAWNFSDNLPFSEFINIAFILTEQEETFKEASHLICISAWKKKKEKRDSETFQSFKWEVLYLR